MSVGASLRSAVRDFYQQSWRLLVLNAVLSVFVLAVLLVGLWFWPVLLLLVLAGPLAAALMHCAVKVAQSEELRLRDAVTGVRLHWRRGLVLGLLTFAVAAGAAFAVPFYAGIGGWWWVPALVALNVAALFAVVQLLLWPLAVLERDRPLSDVARDSVIALLRRPDAVALALLLLGINVVGLVAGLVPFLTLTVAYSFLAAAHFALPREPGGTAAWPA
jgi:MFS family permease